MPLWIVVIFLSGATLCCTALILSKSETLIIASLKKAQPHAISEVIRLAQLGDFSENAEYQQAKGRLRGINEKLLRINYQLDHAEIIDSQSQKNIVQLGNTVTISKGREEKTYQILGSAETDPKKGIISHNSPIGSALLGHKIGDIVTIKLADKEVKYTIIKIA